jgi:hypothetical protein
MNPVTSNLTQALSVGLPPDALQLAAGAPAERAAPRSRAAATDTLAAGATASSASASKARTKATSAKTGAAKAGAAKASATTTAAKAGYASATSLPKELAFLRDPKLSIEDKLMRLAAHLSAKREAEIEKRLEELGGASAKKSGSSGTAGKSKKKGFWGKALDSMKVMFPAVGLSMQLLKTPATKAALKTVGGPVLAAAATALGFPHAAPALLKLGPEVVDFAAGALQAVENAASAEESAAASSTGASASGTGTAKDEQLQLLELNRLVDKQKEMFSLVSNMLKSMHDTKSHVIGNLR